MLMLVKILEISGKTMCYEMNNFQEFIDVMKCLIEFDGEFS